MKSTALIARLVPLLACSALLAAGCGGGGGGSGAQYRGSSGSSAILN